MTYIHGKQIYLKNEVIDTGRCGQSYSTWLISNYIIQQINIQIKAICYILYIEVVKPFK